ncbi:MAG: hypothetical protein INH41_24790 [Myxococcaceae bacterium]|jgi:hypothetical protein|nr:hypothetical protein [Myxococcaceae bacterium]MCA3015618.1 hypothetical protein [Myxococcaceae bacterium]
MTRPSSSLAALALALSACAQDEAKLRTYDNNDLELAVGNAAKMTCTCRFVMQMDEAYCRDWVRASPNVARFEVDPTTKVVTGSAFISWTARARYLDDKRGCALE